MTQLLPSRPPAKRGKRPLLRRALIWEGCHLLNQGAHFAQLFVEANQHLLRGIDIVSIFPELDTSVARGEELDRSRDIVPLVAEVGQQAFTVGHQDRRSERLA
jgi:hypothetical protein